MHLATRTMCIIGAAILVAGCGGGDDAYVDDGASATPGGDPGGAVVGDPGAPVDPGMAGDPGMEGDIDPATGLPMDPAAGGDIGGMDISETIPNLEGSKISGGLAAVGATPLFAPGAVESEKLDDVLGGGDKVSADKSMNSDAAEKVEKKPVVRFSGAKVFVDGVTHDVKVNGTFPKGDPVFKLISVNGKTIEIELVAGEFTTSGGTGVFLNKGETVSVLNQSEQLNYRVKYLRPVTATASIGF
ncbi:MAG: hypothetical protein ABI200_02645 [Gaiellales bacterium]